MSLRFRPEFAALPSQAVAATYTPPDGAKNASSGSLKRLISFAVKPQRGYTFSVPSTLPFSRGATDAERVSPPRA